MKTRALIASDINKVEVTEFELPKLKENEVLVKTSHSTISPGTELRVLSGTQTGHTRFPTILGYSASGIIAESYAKSKRKSGERVFFQGWKPDRANSMWGAHCEFAIVNEKKLITVPENVDLLQASAAKLVAISLHGFKLNRAKPEEKILIVGLGPIGMLSALIHNTSTANIVATDLSEKKRRLAEQLGVKTISPHKGPLASTLSSSYPEGFDSIVDSTGIPKVLNEFVQFGKTPEWGTNEPGSRLVVQGSPNKITLDYNDAFVRETTILIPRDNSRSDVSDSLELMASGKLCIKRLLGAPNDPQDAQEVYNALIEKDDSVITAAFTW